MDSDEIKHEALAQFAAITSLDVGTAKTYLEVSPMVFYKHWPQSVRLLHSQCTSNTGALILSSSKAQSNTKFYAQMAHCLRVVLKVSSVFQ